MAISTVMKGAFRAALTAASAVKIPSACRALAARCRPTTNRTCRLEQPTCPDHRVQPQRTAASISDFHRSFGDAAALWALSCASISSSCGTDTTRAAMPSCVSFCAATAISTSDPRANSDTFYVSLCATIIRALTHGLSLRVDGPQLRHFGGLSASTVGPSMRLAAISPFPRLPSRRRTRTPACSESRATPNICSTPG